MCFHEQEDAAKERIVNEFGEESYHQFVNNLGDDPMTKIDLYVHNDISNNMCDGVNLDDQNVSYFQLDSDVAISPGGYKPHDGWTPICLGGDYSVVTVCLPE